MEIYARHGDLVIEKVAKIDGELFRAKDLVLAGDSSNHPHVLHGSCLHRVEGRRTFVRLAKKTKLSHGKPDGHKTIDMVAGDFEIRPLRERGDGADRAVED